MLSLFYKAEVMPS